MVAGQVMSMVAAWAWSMAAATEKERDVVVAAQVLLHCQVVELDCRQAVRFVPRNQSSRVQSDTLYIPQCPWQSQDPHRHKSRPACGVVACVRARKRQLQRDHHGQWFSSPEADRSIVTAPCCPAIVNAP